MDRPLLCSAYLWRFIRTIQSQKINFLEIGVFNGESMKLWHDYFVNAKNIVGIDIFTRTTIEEVSKIQDGNCE